MTAKLALPASRPIPGRATSAGLGLADMGAMLALAVVAAAIRWPNLLTVPRFTDEQLDVLYTLPLHRLQALPLVGWDPYNGALYSYLLAAALWIFGPQPGTPRLLSLLLGSAAVAVAYLLGRSLGGRLAGWIAAGLLATCATHVLINSHLAWSNAMTPLFTTLAVWALVPAVTRGNGPRLALAALLFGLALQTHPSVVAFIPGAGLALLLCQPALIRSRWTFLAVGLFVLGYADVLAYNFLPGADGYRQAASSLVPSWGAGGDTVGRLEQQQRTYGQSGPQFYLTNLGSLALNLPRVAGGLVEPAPAGSAYLAKPSFWIYGGLVLAGLAWPLRSRNPLPLLSGLTFLMLLPLFIGRFEPIFDGRYLMPLLPLGFAGLGCLVAEVWSGVASRLLRLAVGVAATTLVLYPLIPLFQYEQRAAPDGQINLDLIQSAAALDNSRRPDEPIIVDEALGRRGLPADGDLLQSLRVFLELRAVPYRVGPASAGRLEAELGGAQTALVVFAAPYDRALEDHFRLTTLEPRPGSRYAAYRLERQ